MAVPVVLYSSVWNDDDVLALHPVAEYRAKPLSRQYRTSGWGVPVVIERRPATGRYAEEQFLAPKTLFAATALVRPGPAGGAVLELFDPLHPDALAAVAAPAPLARDLSAPFAFRVVSSPEMVNDWLSFFGIDMPTEQGLFFLEPYQPGKIPVVMVHGLLSNPIAWVDMANDLRATPGFSERFQLWAFRYDTGDPFLASASRLRHDLGRAATTVGAGDPALDQMVLVGHSMGGLISELQASSSEDRLWNSVANRPLPAIITTHETRMTLQDMFFFDPQPNVRCVISLAAPHEGSNWAVRPIGRLGSALAWQEPDRVARHAQLLADNPGVFSDEMAERVPTSVDMLKPQSAILRAIASLPAAPCVRFHTVFGYGQPNLAEGAGDGIVSIESALSPRATSQVGVDASHMNIHRKLEAGAEVLRVLEEQWAAFAGGGHGRGATPRAAARQLGSAGGLH
jgi:pimeloyl-ACP methyl ester carboxylesterase